MFKFVVMGKPFEKLEEAQEFAQRFTEREERTYGNPPIYNYVDEEALAVDKRKS